MSIEQTTRLDGATTGYHTDAVFKLATGEVWQQVRYHYRYHYAYRPEVRLFADGLTQMLQIDGISDAIEVRRVNVVCEGIIVSEFRGFAADARFEFQNRQCWVPAETKYQYQYAHRPEAMVIDGVRGLTLHVDGLDDSLLVRRT